MEKDGVTVNRPHGTTRVSPLLGYAEYQNQFVSSKSTKLFNPFTSVNAFFKAVRSAQDAGEFRSLDQVMRLLVERGQFSRREGQEHHDSAPDYEVFLQTLQCGLVDSRQSLRFHQVLHAPIEVAVPAGIQQAE